MILIINICREKLHELEFVRPIEDILRKNNIEFRTRKYSEVEKEDLNADKIIICGTSLKDNEFVENIDQFDWIKTTGKPVLGICGGMQIISLVFGAKLGKKSEIGFYFEKFEKGFLGLNGMQEVYHLHNYYTSLPNDFESFVDNKILQAIKHRSKEIYGVLFHPEVRQKNLILEFARLV